MVGAGSAQQEQNDLRNLLIDLGAFRVELFGEVFEESVEDVANGEDGLVALDLVLLRKARPTRTSETCNYEKG